MKDSLESILAELYAIDPELRQHEADLRPLVFRLMAAKPDTKFDRSFAETLRRRLMNAEEKARPTLTFSTYMQNIIHSRWAYAASGALVALLLVVPTIYYSQQLAVPGRGDLATALRQASERSILQKGGQAFGSLSSLSQAVTTRSQSGGGGGGMPAIDAKIGTELMYPPFQSFRFTYQGESLLLDAGDVEVLKRLKGLGDTASLASLLSGVGGGLIDLSSFSGTAVRNVELFQDVKDGYSFGINFAEGNVYVNANYERWFNDTFNCGRAECPQPQPLQISDLPSDDQLMAIAAAFINDHGLDVSAFSQPYVDNTWRSGYNSTVDQSNYYIPDVLEVVYPLRLQGQEVRDTGGNVYGLRIQVSIRANKVYGLWGLNSQRYESASYAAETDAQRILKLAQDGGLYNYWGEPAADAKVVGLGTPTKVLMQFIRYSNGQSEELYVPSLLFPVMNAPADMYVPSQVIVPLAKEILDGYQPPIFLKDGVTEPMPLDASTTAPAVQPRG